MIFSFRSTSTARLAASHRRVPVASGGRPLSESEIFLPSVVSGRAMRTLWLKVIRPMASPAARCAAKARAAATAPTIAFPRMLSLASSTRTTPNARLDVWLAGMTEILFTWRPFSRTRTCSLVSATGFAVVITNARSGKRTLASGVSRRPGGAVAWAAAASTAAPAATRSAARSVLIAPAPRPAAVSRTDRPATRGRACGTCFRRSGVVRTTGARRPRYGPASRPLGGS